MKKVNAHTHTTDDRWRTKAFHKNNDINMYNFSFPISTSIDIVSPNEDLFPRVTICNTNPLQYHKFPYESALEDVVVDASIRYNIDNNIYNMTTVGHTIYIHYVE